MKCIPCFPVATIKTPDSFSNFPDKAVLYYENVFLTVYKTHVLIHRKTLSRRTSGTHTS